MTPLLTIVFRDLIPASLPFRMQAGLIWRDEENRGHHQTI
jgi:hypothetical protein